MSGLWTIAMLTLAAPPEAGALPERGVAPPTAGSPQPAIRTSRPTGRVVGAVRSSGAAALVALFSPLSGPPPQPRRYFRVPDHAAFADRLGRIAMTVPSGDYWLTVRCGGTAGRLGPPLPGHRVALFIGDDGRHIRHRVVADRQLDLGSLACGEPFVATPEPRWPATAFDGSVVDAAGLPAAGVVLFAHRNTTLGNRPVFVSAPTDADGRFRIRVSRGGSFVLRVRARYGAGPLEVGEPFGILGRDAPVKVATGKVVDVGTIPLQTFAGQGVPTNPERRRKPAP